MSREKSSPGAHDILKVCDAAYPNAVGASQRSAMAVDEFDSALHAVHQRDINARYSDAMSADDLIVYTNRFHLRAQQAI